jgi:hypothetical protein
LMRCHHRPQSGKSGFGEMQPSCSTSGTTKNWH